jgi:hypothetical protein
MCCNIAGNRKLKLKCPAGARSGQSLAITVPAEKPDVKNELNGPNVKYIPDSDPPGTLGARNICSIHNKYLIQTTLLFYDE